MPSWLAINSAAGIWFGHAAYQLSGAYPRAHQILTHGMPSELIGIIFGVYALLFTAGTVGWGILLNRIGITAALRIGTLGVVAASLSLAGLNHSFGLPVPVVVCFWIGALLSLAAETAFTPAALTLLAIDSDAVRSGRGAVMGIYSMLLAGGELLGSLIGVVFAGADGVDGLIIASLGLGAVAFLTLPGSIAVAQQSTLMQSSSGLE